MKKFTIFSIFAVIISLTANSVFAEPPDGKGNKKNWAITAFDESAITCAGVSDADVPAEGTINVGSTTAQCYQYSLTIPSAVPEGTKILEQLTSTFNLAPDAESDAHEGFCDEENVCSGCTDGACDGVASSDIAACEVFTSRPDSAVKLTTGNIPAHQDELVVISKLGAAGCTVTIYAITDGAQEGFREDETGYDLFLPTSCTPLREHTRYDPDGDGDADNEDKLLGIIVNGSGLPFVEYVPLTTGTRAFLPSTFLYRKNGNRNGDGGFAEFRSLQLQPKNCDTDGDSTTDEFDSFPLDPTQ